METGLGSAFDTFGTAKVLAIRDKARSILESLGIDVESLLARSPHGSLLRSAVLLDHLPESDAGVAARLYEATAHFLAYAEMPGHESQLPWLAYRIGRLDLVADTILSQRIRRQREKAGIGSGEQRRQMRESDWLAWQAAANKVWSKNPSLSKAAVAERIAPEFAAQPGTIRRRITKPPRK